MPMAALPFFRRAESDRDREKREILEAMRQTREELRQARAFFNDAREPELVEASVYEINALQARYAYFLRLAKELKCEEAAGGAFRPPPKMASGDK